jgi:putative drug exporter of the RND superfamily
MDKNGAVTEKLGNLVASRRSKWVVVAIWLLIIGVTGAYSGKLTEVEKNEPKNYLPGNAESTQVLDMQESFPNSKDVPTIVAYQRLSGLTSADRQQIESDKAKLVAQYDHTGRSVATIPSDDGKTALYTVTLDGNGESKEATERLQQQIESIRDMVGSGANGLDVKVTGAGGVIYDSIEAFQGLDTTLLFTTVIVVALILLLTYRSPVLWLIPLVCAMGALGFVSFLAYQLADHNILVISGQTGGILTVLVFGASTDYALLLVARYREELRRHEDKHEAMHIALQNAGPAIFASGSTVVISLLCLLVSQLESNKGLGPIGALGIAGAMLAMFTLLPATLVVFGRRLFWPFVPRFGSHTHEESGPWHRVGTAISHRPRITWIATAIVLLVMAFGATGMNTGLTQAEQFRSEPDSIKGTKLLEVSFPAGSALPLEVVAHTQNADAVKALLQSNPHVAQVIPVNGDEKNVQYNVTLDTEPDSAAEGDIIRSLRHQLGAVNPPALVGGAGAQNLDVASAAHRDTVTIIPIVLLVVLVILGLLLRAVTAALILMGTVIVSFTAALGVSVLVFEHLFGFAGVDDSFILISFIFLVALGIDYNIFLMTRIREESLTAGTRTGTLRGLAVTGGVITSAGIVLAATFSVLAVLPLVVLTEVGFLVAFGVLLDTFIVRSILVPALTLDLDKRIWWPSKSFR